MESSSSIPEKVTAVLKTSSIGYLTTLSKKGELYTYPMAFYYSNGRVFFMTPVSAAKYKMIRVNPTVSMIVDNKELASSGCGAMIQGKARIFSVTRTILSILSVGPKIAGFSKKYPGMLSYYAKGKGFPDERKLYKYRLIQINPVKIVYWIGYEFGRYVPVKRKRGMGRLGLVGDKDDATAMISLLGSADDEEEVSQMAQSPGDHDWVVKLNEASSGGLLTSQEQRLLSAFRSIVLNTGSKLSDQEKRLLQQWRRQGRQSLGSVRRAS